METSVGLREWDLFVTSLFTRSATWTGGGTDGMRTRKTNAVEERESKRIILPRLSRRPLCMPIIKLM